MPPPIALSARLRPRSGLLIRELDGEAVLLDAATGRYYGLNATGLRIFGLLDGERTLEEVRQLLLAEHDVAPERLTAEFLQLVAELRAEELVLAPESR